MENIKFSTTRESNAAQDWLIGESLGALLAIDNQKIAVLNEYDTTI